MNQQHTNRVGIWKRLVSFLSRLVAPNTGDAECDEDPPMITGIDPAAMAKKKRNVPFDVTVTCTGTHNPTGNPPNPITINVLITNDGQSSMKTASHQGGTTWKASSCSWPNVEFVILLVTAVNNQGSHTSGHEIQITN